MTYLISILTRSKWGF